MLFNKKMTKFITLIISTMLLFSACSQGSSTTNEEIKDETNKQVQAEEKQATDSEQEVAQAKNDESIRYISASKLNVRETPDSAGTILDSLLKGSKIKVLSESKNEAGELWYEVEYKTFDGNKKGHISAEYTVSKREELLDEHLRGLDFSAFEKIEYKNNKKVKVKGVYVTVNSAAGAKLDSLIKLAEETEINAFVIDVKDDFGNMLFKTKAAEKYAPSANDKAPIKNIDEFIKKLKEKDIYTIARIVSFKDPTYAQYNTDKVIINKQTNQPFVNKDGIIWVSPHDRTLWDYNIAVAKEAAIAGFNEIQFDYVRFPASDGGKLDEILDYRNEKNEGKAETIQNYLKQAYSVISKEEAYISADVYGLVGSVPDDMHLGQYWEAVSNYTDYISPMMYPSHYANGTYGVAVPDADPYNTLLQGAKDAVLRNENLETPAQIRPWIQSFTASWVKGYIKYGPEQVKAQIKALNDAGIEEYLLWSASNNYDIK